MCFKNLPIEFDEQGRAHMREGVANPYSLDKRPKPFTKRPTPVGGAVAAPPKVREWMIDPMTRVAGALAIHVDMDLDRREIVDAHSMAMLFRGYEIILKGRDPRRGPLERRLAWAGHGLRREAPAYGNMRSQPR
jgi:hydrogenase large subunit